MTGQQRSVSWVAPWAELLEGFASLGSNPPTANLLIFPWDVLRNSAESVSRNHWPRVRTASPKRSLRTGRPH